MTTTSNTPIQTTKPKRQSLVSCRYCGRMHRRGEACPKRPKRIHGRGKGEASEFRATNKWKQKSLEIRQRDNNLCQACLCGKYFSTRSLTWNKLSVHHIVPLTEDPTRSLDNRNLITLCDLHHEMAESGEIPRDELLEMASRREEERISDTVDCLIV